MQTDSHRVFLAKVHTHFCNTFHATLFFVRALTEISSRENKLIIITFSLLFSWVIVPICLGNLGKLIFQSFQFLVFPYVFPRAK